MTIRADPPYRDAALPVGERVEDLLSRMTLEEKAAQLGSRWVYELLDGRALDPGRADALLSRGVGQITRLAGASSLGPRACAELANALQRYLREATRLGIPAMIHEECCSGYTAQDATAFPQMIGLASSWEPELAEAMTTEVRRQMRAVGAHQGLSPILDVGRDPRWGRVEETFGEDPHLIARFGVAYVRGLQGDAPHHGVVATVKHFVGYSVTEGGLNWAPAHLGERELREIYLYPFEVAVRLGGARSLMAGYHELDGVPVSASRRLMTELLRHEWGFDGVVVSDYMAIDSLRDYHAYARDAGEAARLALEAGVDVELPSTDCYGAPLLRAVEEGLVPESLVDESVRRVLRAKFELGLFERPYVDPEAAPSAFDTVEQRALARTIAERSLVLLKNEGGLLPLAPDLPSVAVVGPNADSVRNLLGDYSYPAHIELLLDMRGEGLSDTPLPDTTDLEVVYVPMKTVREAIADAVSPGTAVHYARGCDVMGESRDGFAEAVAAAERSEVCLVVVGDKSGLARSCTSGEFRDRATLGLPGVQEELVRAVVATGTPVVVVFVNGRPVSSPWIAEHATAVLEAWLPGEEGADAVAAALFGRVNPGGKLPLTVARSAGQVPLYYNRKPSGGRSFPYGPYVDESNEPLYPFGFGLSYTTFALGAPELDGAELRAGGTLELSVEVTNTGEREGDEVVQLYSRYHGASVTRPVKELKGFRRVTLLPGETKTVRFTLHADQFAYLDGRMRRVLEPGRLELMVGACSEGPLLRAEVGIGGEPAEVGAAAAFFGDVRVD